MAKKFLIFFLVFGLFVYHAGRIAAYDEYTTHPALTNEIVDFYNAGSGGITSEEKEWIIEGSIEEDMTPRWVNHFYDPIYNVAWTGANVGFISPSTVNALLYIGLSSEGALTAVDWANNQPAQEKYALYGGDRTWKRALKYYADGDKKEAYVTLGHILHLTEDMTVPEHTRDDPHAHDFTAVTGDYGSPYEEYTKKWNRTTIKELQIAENLLKENAVTPKMTAIEDYLTVLAQYSNKYFFSKDTINDQKYSLPKIIREDSNFGYGVDEDSREFPLVLASHKINNGEPQTIYSLENKEGYYPILDAYFSRLSRQAVLNGAGVIALFEKQASDAVVNKEFPQRLVMVDPNVAKWFSLPQFSLFGELERAWGFITELGAATLAIFDRFLIAVGPGVSSIGPTQPPPNPPPSNATTTKTFSNTGGPTNSPNATTTVVTSTANIIQLPATQRNPLASTVMTTLNSPITIIYGGGGGAFAPIGGPSPPGLEPPPPPPLPPSITNFQAAFSTSTFAINFSWDALAVTSSTTSTGSGQATSTITYAINDITTVGTSTLVTETASTSATWLPTVYNHTYTFSIQAFDLGTPDSTSPSATSSGPSGPPQAVSATSTASVFVPEMFFTVQPLDNESSIGSHNQKNWYQLGTGFYGTVYALTLKGSIGGGNSDIVLPSRVSIQEFLDPAYSRLNRTFDVSDGTVFDREQKTVTIKGLNIPLQPNKYYLLTTVNALQNASVFLLGTSATGTACGEPCGTAMWNEFIGGIGLVEHTYYFYPYLRLTMLKDYPPQSAPSPPGNLTLSFDEFNLGLGISWSSSTDPDTIDKLIKYEVNISTSTDLDSGSWKPVAGMSTSTAVVYPNSYTVGVRALDDFGNTSAPAVAIFSFPAGFTASTLSNRYNSASQDFVLGSGSSTGFTAGGHLNSIQVFTADFDTDSRDPDSNTCSIDLYKVNETSTVLLAQSDNLYAGYNCAALPLTFTYTSSTPEIVAGQKYQWVFYFSRFGSRSGHGGVRFWGKNIDTAGGLWSGGEFLNAKFTLAADSSSTPLTAGSSTPLTAGGVLFEN